MLSQLLQQAAAGRAQGLAYAGEVTPTEVYRYIQAEPALVVDVRTLPEWQFTGLPALEGTKGQLATISWKLYPDFTTNPRFAEQLSQSCGGAREVPIFFLCRSGGRSLDAAVAMSAQGYNYCFNVTGGFEGDPDATGHRGTKNGWKAEHLPWKQG